jgi:hypothetical protein
MSKVIVQVSQFRKKKQVYKTVVFTDVGDGKVKDRNGNVYQMTITSPTGGVLKGDTNISFRFPV